MNWKELSDRLILEAFEYAISQDYDYSLEQQFQYCLITIEQSEEHTSYMIDNNASEFEAIVKTMSSECKSLIRHSLKGLY